MSFFLKSRWFWLSSAIFVAVTLAAFPGSRWPILGWVKGESFYRGRPTSYWRAELQQWSERFYFNADGHGGFLETRGWYRQPLPEGFWLNKFPWVNRAVASDKLPLMQGEVEAAQVLADLLADADWQNKRIATLGLGKIGPAAKPQWGLLWNLYVGMIANADLSLVEKCVFANTLAAALWRIDPKAAAALDIPQVGWRDWQ